MNLSINLRQQMQTLGSGGAAVLRNFEQWLQTLTSWGQAEHNEDGTHANVTATTAIVNGLLQAERYRPSNILVWDYALDNSGVIKGAGVVDAGLIVHVDRTVGAGGVARTLYAIDATGRKPGEVVWFLCVDGNTAPGGINFSQRASSANRQGFPGFQNFTGVIGANVLLQANRLVPLMYLPPEGYGEASVTSSHPWYIGHP